MTDNTESSESQRRFNKALQNYYAMVDWDLDAELLKSFDSEIKPTDVQDPLEWLGDISALQWTAEEEQYARKLVAETLATKGEDYIWNSRIMQKHQLQILFRF